MDNSRDFVDLRRRAQILLSEPQNFVQAGTPEEFMRLIHELDTYQIELELQNEDLLQSQEELYTSRKRFSDLFDFAPVGYCTISDKGMIVEVNLTAADMLRVERGYLLTNPFSSFVADADMEIYYFNRKRLLETKMSQNCELRMKRSDKSLFFAQLKFIVSADVDGSSGQFRIVITDISEQKKLEKILASKSLNQILLNAFPSLAMLIRYENHEIIASNQAARNFGAVEGTTCYQTWKKRNAPCPECRVPQLLNSGEPQQLEMFMHGKVWDIKWLPVSDDLYMLYSEDITERVRNEDRISQALKMQAVGTLAGGIAHEFNNLLAIIMGCSELAKDMIPPESAVRIQIDRVFMASCRARDLVKQILTFSRQSQQKRVVAPLGLFVIDAVRLIESSLPSSVEVKLDIIPDKKKVFIDPTEIQQIVMNVCANAVAAMKEKGNLLITLRPIVMTELEGRIHGVPAGEYMVLSFCDTGSGMDKETLARIFDPFFTTKEVGEGTGMGLSITHSIMESYGGKIDVASEVGTGTTFQFYFPVIDKPVADRNDKNQTVAEGREHILFVDDQEQYAEMSQEILSNLGYDVEAITDSKEALDVFKSSADSFDLVITDQVMPGLSGEELVREIRSIRPDIPVILCTGYSSQMDREKARSLGINEFAYKPIEKRDLARLIRKALDGA